MKARKGDKHYFCRKVPVLQYLYYLCQVRSCKKPFLVTFVFEEIWHKLVSDWNCYESSLKQLSLPQLQSFSVARLPCQVTRTVANMSWLDVVCSIRIISPCLDFKTTILRGPNKDNLSQFKPQSSGASTSQSQRMTLFSSTSPRSPWWRNIVLPRRWI